MEEDSIPISEYTAKYCWKENPDFKRTQYTPDFYETLVQKKMNGDDEDSVSRWG